MTEYAEVNIGFRAVTGIGEMNSVLGFIALLAKTVGNCHWQVTPGLKPVSAGSLVYEWSDISVSRVLENIEGNIVGNIVQAATALNRWHFVGRLFRIQTACQQGVLPTTDNRAD